MRNQRLWTFLFVSCLCGIAGCVEIERTIRLNVDGSGQLVEVIRFDDRLVQTAKSSPQFDGLMDFLEEKHVRERLALYGKVTLVRHDVKDLGGKGREATTILAFKNINEVTLPALPHRSATWTDQNVVFRLGEEHVFKPNWLGPASIRKPLQIGFSPPGKKTPGVESAPTPAQRQEIARILPVVRTMIDGFRVTVKLEAFGPIWQGTGSTHVLYDVRADDLDDEILIKLFEWNSTPDPKLAFPRGTMPVSLESGRTGRIMTGDHTLEIAPPGAKPVDTTPQTAKPPKKGKKQ